MTARRSLVWAGAALGLGVVLAMWITSAGVSSIGGGTSPNGDAIMSMAAVTDSRNDAEPVSAISALAVSSRPAGVDDQLYEGAWLVDQTKQLGSSGGWTMYAVPTDRGRVCYAMVRLDSAAGACVKSFMPEQPISVTVYDPDLVNAGVPVVVGGLASDQVSHVFVVVDGAKQQAALAKNSFLYELEDPQSYPSEVIVWTADGSTSISLQDPRPAMLAAQG